MGDEVPAQGCRLVLVSITGCLCQTTSLGRSGVEEGAAHPPSFLMRPAGMASFVGPRWQSPQPITRALVVSPSRKEAGGKSEPPARLGSLLRWERQADGAGAGAHLVPAGVLQALPDVILGFGNGGKRR